jgi:hypothetical protein
MNPFYRWLNKLVGIKVKITLITGTSQEIYDGKLVFVEPRLAVVNEKGKVYLILTKDISDMSFDKKMFTEKPVWDGTGHPYCRWLKALENKDVKINTLVKNEGFTYRGKIAGVDKELCFFEETGEEDRVCVLRVDRIIEVLADETSLSLRSEIEIEEIE